MPVSDESLIERLADGDRDAFATLYDRHSPRVFGLLSSLMRDYATAEDVLQETFLHIWKRANRFSRTRGSGATWIAVIARSRALDHLRKRRTPALNTDMNEAAELSDPSQQMRDGESTTEVRGALLSLSNEQRSAITMAYYGGMTHETIAQTTEIPLGTVKTRIRLAMQRLRDTLGSPDGVRSI